MVRWSSVLFLICRWVYVHADHCDLSDSSNHICLHTFLERDFPLIEEMVNKPNFIREGREFEDMCLPVAEMIACYDDLLDNCPVRSYWRERANFIRVLFAVRGMSDVLCGNKSFALQQITRQATCIESARRYGYCDDHLGHGVQLLTFFNRMMRFEATDSACQPLTDFRQCLIRNAQENGCQAVAMTFITRALDQWTYHFCHRAGILTSSSTYPQTFDLKMFTIFIVIMRLLTVTSCQLH